MFTMLSIAIGLAVVGMAIQEGFWADRMMADRDRHSTNATTLTNLLEIGYADGKEFRQATAGRIILEAGSGRTRAETNNPGNTAAPNITPGP